MASSMRLGIAAVIGDGKQPFSWIALDDLLRAIEHLILNTYCKGVYNLTAPKPTTNINLTKHLASKLSTPITLHIPKLLFKIAMGKSSVLLTTGQYVLPKRLSQDGFKFKYESITDYIDHITL